MYFGCIGIAHRGKHKKVDYRGGYIEGKDDKKCWKVFLPAPLKMDCTRQWGAKASREAQFAAAIALIDSKWDAVAADGGA